MFAMLKDVFTCFTILLCISTTCTSDLQPPYLALYSPKDTEYTDVLVRQADDNLTLVCEVRGDSTPRVFVWNYVSDNGTDGGRPLTIEPAGASSSSKLERTNLQPSDSGHYMCSAPPFSITKYILVQTRGPKHCARGAFWCGIRCVLPAYVCDGRRDCVHAEDESPPLCEPNPCMGNDKLNCSSGRCIPLAACCRPGATLCRQPACCDEHPKYSNNNNLEGYVEVEYPPLYEDRHAPDDYGFIQSTIYTVTACALIFMIAVVLLVSALCKMHMKRAALRGYAHAHRDTRQHYAARYPPRYEATRLLDGPASPVRSVQVSSEPCSPSPPQSPPEVTSPPQCSGFGLSRLSAMFCSRYRQVPTQCCEVEMTDVRAATLNDSPNRIRSDYQSPTYCESEYYPDITARELNYMATPIEFFRRRTFRRNTIDRVIDQLTVQRPLTLHLGRFQLSIPRFGRQEPRPDTPNIAEINIDDLDFVRLNSNDTYTLNGRTIRLLGASFENYPVLDSSRPPPYNEAMRQKYGPPPEYLSRERINNNDSEIEARSNVEMPPCYDDLASGVDSNANIAVTDVVSDDNDNNLFVSPVNNETNNVINDNSTINNGNNDSNAINNVIVNKSIINDNDVVNSVNSDVPESISSVIDNLPAIDSDVNANETYDNAVSVQE